MAGFFVVGTSDNINLKEKLSINLNLEDLTWEIESNGIQLDAQHHSIEGRIATHLSDLEMDDIIQCHGVKLMGRTMDTM